MGKLAQDNKALDPMDTVNGAVVLRKCTVLSGEICLTCFSNGATSPVLAEPGYQRPGLFDCYRQSGAWNTNRIAFVSACLSALYGNIKRDQTEVSRGHSSPTPGVMLRTW